MDELPQLSLSEWIVLALVVERPRHGFAIAALTAVDGDVGRAWHVPRPIVYRAADRLLDAELIRVEGTEQGARGPQRSVLAAKPTGVTVTRRWLSRAVRHVRDGRSELLVKLALLVRRGHSTRALVARQRLVYRDIEAALMAQLDGDAGFDRMLITWRAENVRGALRFLDAVEQDSKLGMGAVAAQKLD